jgi:hypothetical protein
MKSNMWQFSENREGMPISDAMYIHFDNFSKNYPTIAGCSDKIEMHQTYFEDKMKGEFWYWHGVMLDNIGITNAPKDTSILDMGSQLGFIPHFLKEYGFNDVDCTNSSVEANEHLYELELIWKEMKLSPLDLHISPEKEFTLHKKYDIILCTQTNTLWNTERLVTFHWGQVKKENYVVDKNNESHMFFIPYNTDELIFFINNIKKYLNEGGIAVIQPFPFPYYIEGFEKELELLKTYQVKGRPDKHNKEKDYFVITK